MLRVCPFYRRAALCASRRIAVANPKFKIQNYYPYHSQPRYTESAVQNFSGREMRTRSPKTL